MREVPRVREAIADAQRQHRSAQAYASRSIETRIGGSFDVYGVAWQYRWGAGL